MNRFCKNAMKPVTFDGTSFGDGNTACTSCIGNANSCSNGTTAPLRTDAAAT